MKYIGKIFWDIYALKIVNYNEFDLYNDVSIYPTATVFAVCACIPLWQRTLKFLFKVR